MDHYFVFQYRKDKKGKIDHTLVLFCCGLTIEKSIVQKKLRAFFYTNPPPSEIIIIGGEYIKNILVKEFTKKNSDILFTIPPYLLEVEIKVLVFNQEGQLFDLKTKSLVAAKKSNEIFNKGRDFIFKSREALIKSPSETYHYIFPSKKHSSKFIRAGNTLIDSSEIFFIAMTLLSRLKPHFTQIYCDTSSINTLAFALIELKARFSKDFKYPSVVSFGSYEKFEKFEFYDPDNSLILISASTSGNIVKRLREHNKSLELENMLILFYLSDDKEFSSIIIHDLTYQKESNPNGIRLDEIFENEDKCKLCEKGSYTVKIVGDTFLLEKPKIKTIVIEKRDCPDWLNEFMRQFYSDENGSLIRCYYGEDRFKTLEIHFDIISLFKSFSTSITKYNNYKTRFNKLINQYVPSGLKAIIYLNDEASKHMAESILHFHSGENVPLFCSDKNLTKNLTNGKVRNDSGAILVVSSSMVTGNSLLIVNKLLRGFNNLTITFLVGIARPANNSHFSFVKSNLSYGKDFGITSNHFVAAEKICCSDSIGNNNSSNDLSWGKELIVMKLLKEIADNNKSFKNSGININERIKILETANDINRKGLSNNVFLKNFRNGKILAINKNFAFYDFDGYFKKTTQADIYFTISTILNELRNSSTSENRITQDEHVRSLLAPENFIRYDDGIIQASILRAAKEEELNYMLDADQSKKIYDIIMRMVENQSDLVATESLPEFLLAISLRKLRLLDSHLKQLTAKIQNDISNDTIRLLAFYIDREILRIKTRKKRSEKKAKRP